MIYLTSLPWKEISQHNAASTMPKPSDQQISDFYVRLGLVIAAWQFVEAALVYAYGKAIGATNPTPLTASFHVPTNISVRLSMTDQAVKRSGIDAALLSEWEKLSAQVSQKMKRRNKLAHSIVIFDPHKKPDRQLFLSPNVDDPTRFDPLFSPGSIITRPELDDMLKVFEELHQRLTEFHQRLPPLPAKPQSASPLSPTS